MALFVDSPAPDLDVPGDGALFARIRTNQGEIVVRLLEDAAPRTVATFVALATGALPWTDAQGRTRTEPIYTGTTFHRVLPGALIQGGDPKGDGTGGPGFRWGEEAAALAVPHDRAVLAMARLSSPSSQGCQFYLTEGPMPDLDGGYSVFGHVTEGVERIAAIARLPRNQQDRPLTPVKIKGVDVFRG